MSLKLKRHHSLIVLLVVVTVALILVLGNEPIIAYSGRGIEQVVAQSLS